VQVGYRLRGLGADLGWVMACLGLARAAASSSLIWPGREAWLRASGPQRAATQIRADSQAVRQAAERVLEDLEVQ
jgi:uncharacterized iron-regulated membrane protein